MATSWTNLSKSSAPTWTHPSKSAAPSWSHGTKTPTDYDYLLQEGLDRILQETGDGILLEDTAIGWTFQTKN